MIKNYTMEYTFLHLTRLNSSNSYAKQLLQEGNAVENTVILSDYQDDGRGQGDNRWISDKGKNLLMSWILHAEFLAVSDQFMLSKTVSLGICDAMEQLELDIQIKWPNDIICGNKKMGGILIENSIQGEVLKNSIIGIGMNVNQLVFPSFPFPATSLLNETRKSITIPELSELLMSHLMGRYMQLKDKKYEILDAAYLDKLFRRNIVSVFEAEGERFEGKIKGVNKFGELELEISGSTRSFGFHDVRMIH
jgi:BirA family transcriptional regulator, biotin operon repressor / biotin---[acetyl-CoA-carboxylase] ligase